MPLFLQDPQKTMSETLHHVARSVHAERITLRELLELVGEQGLLVFCMFLTIPFLLPVSIPGVSTVFGLVITLVGMGVMLNRVPWLPGTLMNRAIERAHLIPTLEKAAHLFARMDKLVRPRWLALTHGATVNRLNGFLLVVGAILLMVPLGLIPFSNTLPTLAILCLAGGMLQRDGIFVALGYVTLMGTVAYFTALIGAALLAGHGIGTLLAT